MNLPKITESIIRAGTSAHSFQRGQEYHHSGAISNPSIQGTILAGLCEGTQEPYYKVRIELDNAGVRAAQCTCAYDYGGYCKHQVALLLHYLHRPKDFAIRQEPAELLTNLSREDLLALVTRLLHAQPDLYDWFEAALAKPAQPGKTKQTRRKKVDVEVYRRQVRGILHSLDAMRPSEAYWQVGGLVEQLGEVQATAVKFLEADEPETALHILLTLLEEVGKGADYIDDSNGELGDFANGLGLPLAEAILSLDLSAVERQKLTQKLTKVGKRLGDYGMDEAVDLALQAAHEGWEGPVTLRSGSSHAAEDEREAEAFEDEDEIDSEAEDEEAYWRSHDSTDTYADLTEAKLNVLERKGCTDEYLALCQKAERYLRYALKLCDLKHVPEAVTFAKAHLGSAEEALTLAERLRDSRHTAEALAIGEHGLQLSGSKARLGEWLGPLEETQERMEQALRAWLAVFSEGPSLESYKTIKRLSAVGWGTLRPMVMDTLQKSYEKQAQAEILIFEEAWDEAIKVADQHNVWYRVVETVADAVVQQRPEWVVKITRQHAEALVAEANSKNYPIAADWLKRMKKAYQVLGKMDEWQTYLQGIKDQYKRRPALQAQLKRL